MLERGGELVTRVVANRRELVPRSFSITCCRGQVFTLTNIRHSRTLVSAATATSA